MNLKVEVKNLENIDKAEWNVVLEKSKHATLFHTLKWLKIQKEVLGLDEKLIILKEKNPLAIFPFFIKKKIFTIYGSPLPETGAFYGGPVLVEQKEKLLKECLRPFENLGTLTSFFMKTPNKYDISFFHPNYEVEPIKNYIVELDTPLEVLWKKLESRTRRAVKKAQRSKVRIEMGSIEQLDEYYKIVLHLAERNRIVPLPRLFYERVLSEIENIFLIAYHHENLIAGGIFPIFKDTVLYWDGASYSKYWKYQANSLIFWRLIELAKERGLRRYDLGGAGIPTITKFKRGWGGKEVYYYRIYKEGSPILKVARRTYQKLRIYPWVRKFFRSN
jgi:lipid II:glycine glycyltransferase (peptidoglycan interpeptide bridge formation enzyme)